MNQESFQFNKDQLLNLGFGDEIAAALHTKMNQNLSEFTLNHTRKFGKDVVDSALYFSKGDDLGKDITFFNRFDATLKQDGKEDLTQTFFVGAKHNYTLQERYNMLDGRAVYREQPMMKPTVENGVEKMKPTGETYFAWRTLDFKTADRFGNFHPKVVFWDHEKELKKYPIKGVEENYNRKRIMRPLEKGNRVDLILLRDGVETTAKVVANPRMMRLDFYDDNGQSLIVRKVEKKAQSQQVAQTPQEVQKAAIGRAAEISAQSSQGLQKQAGREEAIGETAKGNINAKQEQEQEPRRKQGVRL